MRETIDRRVLGALEVQDGVTGHRLDRPVRITATDARTVRTIGGLYAITQADGLVPHLEAFAMPPAAPALGSIPIRFVVEDPLGAFLPISTTVLLPRDPASEAGAGSLFTPLAIPLPSTPARRIALGWVALRVSLTDGAGAPVRGAYLEVLPAAGGARLGWGLTDPRGEALVPVPSIPLLRAVDTTPLDPDDPDHVVTDQTAVTLTAIADPVRPWPGDPQRLAADRAGLRTAGLPGPVALTAGATTHHPMTIDLS